VISPSASASAEPEPDPPPVLVPLAPPLMQGHFRCPHCGREQRFYQRPARPDDLPTRICRCGRLLGLVVVDKAGMTLLRLVTAT
jgi:hypothetical protein